MTQIIVTRGSDLSIPVTWLNAAGGAVDLTDYTVEVFETGPDLTDKVAIAVTTAASGLTTVTVSIGDPPIRLGLHRFRVRIISDTSFHTASTEIVLSVT